MQGVKLTTATTEKYGGIHNPRQYYKALGMVDDCISQFDRPRMYHLCLTGADSRAPYKSAIKRICRRLAEMGLLYRYKAAVEHSGKKGLHIHVFIITDHPRSGVKNPCSFLNNDKQGALAVMLQEFGDCGLRHWIAMPDNALGADNFLQLNKPERIADAKDWISYMHKANTKLDSGQTYYSSRA